MSKVFKPRRGSTSQVAPFVGEAHEVILNTTTNTLHVMDGLTAGGFPLAKEGDLNSFKASQSTRDAEQDAAISAAQNAASKALVSAVIEDGELVLTYGDGTVKRESLPGGLPLGTLMPYTGKDVPAGFLRADGATYTGMRASFPEFYEWVVASGLTVPLADYALVEGSCGFYGLDQSTGTVRMPTLAAGVFGTTAAGQYGAAVQAGLPNITGQFGAVKSYKQPTTTGAFGYAGQGTADVGDYADTPRYENLYGFDASLSSPIYGASDTVQPPHVKYPWVISVYNAAVSPSVAEASQFVGLLDGKADVNLGNVTDEGKAAVVGWGMPDYSAGVDIVAYSSSGYTAPTNGFVTLGWGNITDEVYILVNGVKVSGKERTAGASYVNASALVKKGDVIKTTGNYELTLFVFFPLGRG